MQFRKTGLCWIAILSVLAAVCGAETTPADQELLDSINKRRQLSRGAVLIAGRNLQDPNFSRSVILITEYNELGTTGLIINRPLKITAQKAFPPIDQITTKAGNLFVGGPVGVNNLQILVETGSRFQQYKSVTGDIYLVNNPRAFSSLTEHEDKDMRLRIYVGYAGWASGQLESEIIRGDWYIWHADSSIVFSEAPESVWEELIELVTVQWAEYNQWLYFNQSAPVITKCDVVHISGHVRDCISL